MLSKNAVEMIDKGTAFYNHLFLVECIQRLETYGRHLSPEYIYYAG